MNYDHTYFADKTGVVTGGASGIGLALIEELLKSGASKVVMVDINQQRLQECEKRLLEQYPGKVKGILCDVTSDEQVRQMIGDSAAFCGRIDLLFNNAGAGFQGWFADLTDEDWKKAFDLNFYGALYGMRAVLPIMQKQGGGQIVNIISGIAFSPMARQTMYSATKAALNGLSLALRYEYWDDGIKISSATPGTTATNIFAGAKEGVPPDAQTPEQSASRILNGVVNNDRVIYGSDSDAEGGSFCFNPSPEAQEGYDSYLLRVARERHAGKDAF